MLEIKLQEATLIRFFASLNKLTRSYKFVQALGDLSGDWAHTSVTLKEEWLL
jgi:hypothetical protein